MSLALSSTAPPAACGGGSGGSGGGDTAAVLTTRQPMTDAEALFANWRQGRRMLHNVAAAMFSADGNDFSVGTVRGLLF